MVTSVPISHATPAAAYANNVTRNDYQDLSRDLVGLPSIAHRSATLPGVDVLLGCGWGEESDGDDKQGQNYVPGNKYLPNPRSTRWTIATAASTSSPDARRANRAEKC